MTNEILRERINKCQERLEAYQAQELKMLRDGVQSYGIGSRNVARYSIDLENVRKAIKELQIEIDAMTEQLNSGSLRKVVGVVIRDW